MRTKIATTTTFEHAARVVVQEWRLSWPFIRLEGFDGVGKSGIAKLVSGLISAEHVEADKFAVKHDEPPPYPDCLRLAALESKTFAAFASKNTPILDAVCSRQVWPIERWGRGYVVYVKRLSFNNLTPIWHDGISIEEDSAPLREPQRSIFEYHHRYLPHLTADLIIELPDDGHIIRTLSFDRAMCLDPPDAEVLPFEPKT